MTASLFDEGNKEEEVVDTEFEKKAVNFLQQVEPETPVSIEHVPPMVLTPPAKNVSGPWIKYNGVGVVRNITSAEWRACGVRDQGDTQWNYLNNYRIPVSALSEAAIKYCLEVDGRFTKVD